MSDRQDLPHSLGAALTPPGGDRGSAPALPDGSAGRAFVPGTVFAGRYRMVTRVGEGGMGEVWRADDLVLDTPVALKLLFSASEGARARLFREVRLARRITHPAVCRVFDAGESSGQVFYSMEFVEGRDLSTLLRRAGRLAQERVVDIGRQICEGVAAAHSQGVLHRDLKPANVLVDENGSIRITDFGIAIARTDGNDQALIGTPGYMAPEQMTLGAPITERTDVFAIGAILYELLVGQGPFADAPMARVAVQPPSMFVPDVDPRLEALILKALSPSPEARPASAAAVAAALPTLSRQSNRRRLLPWVGGGVLAASIAVLAILSSLVWSQPTAALTDQDTIVLADFVNTTDDPVFDGALKVALAVALEQSPFLRVFPDDALTETLRLMQRQPDEKVTRSLAREIAMREQLKAVVSGSISPLGSRYVIALEAVNADSGDIMAREQVEVLSKEQVLTSLGQATAKLREKLGESLPSIRRFDVPLARATTPSLEALNAYSLALDDGRVFIRVEAIPHLKRAIELDPDFALAHALLSGIYANTGQTADAPPHARRAYELRDRVSERERYFISWRYYLDALQSWDRALELASSWTAAYPRESFAFNSLGLAAASFGQHERAIEAFRQAIRLDPKFIPPHRNLAGSMIALGRFDEARRLLDGAAASGVSSIGIKQVSFLVDFITGKAPVSSSTAFAANTTEERMWAINSRAQAETFSGHFAAAHGLFQQGVQLARQEGFEEVAGRWILEDAESHALAGRCDVAQREMASGLELTRDNFALERAARALGWCGQPQAATRIADELRRRFPDATLTTRVQLPLIEALVALHGGNATLARALLAPITTYDHTPAAELWPQYLRGVASLQLGDARAASLEFQSILDHRGDAPTSPLYALSQLGLARARVGAGDESGGRLGYQAFFSLWQGADQDIRPLAEARKEFARLQ